MSLNVTQGRQQQSASRSTALPTVPVPMFALRVPAKRFVFAAEGMPPIGPIGYNSGLEATKLSYLASELRWRDSANRFEVGAGTTLLNQVTEYPRSLVAPQQSSRVAGFRMTFAYAFESKLDSQTRLRLSLSPSMHGLQVTKLDEYSICRGFPPAPASCRTVYSYIDDAELASLVDAEFVRTQRVGSLGLAYGVRYINYAVRFAARNLQADRERMLMPFIGLNVSLGR